MAALCFEVIACVLTHGGFCGASAGIRSCGVRGEGELIAVPRLTEGPRAGQEALAENLYGEGPDPLALPALTGHGEFHGLTKILEGEGEAFLAGIQGNGERGKLAFAETRRLGPELRCIEAATGTVQWSRDDLGAGSVTLARDQLLVLAERGELILATATEKGFQPRARAQVLGSNTRAFPALANGLWFGRDTRQLVCLELATGTGRAP